MRHAAALLLLAFAAAGCASVETAEAARKRNTDALTSKSAEIEGRGQRPWVVVQDGAVAASGFTADDAVRAAAVRGVPSHRFVFRAADRGDRLYRLAFLPESGTVAGRRLLADLGFRVVSVDSSGPGRVAVLERRGSRRPLDLARTPRITLELSPLGGGASQVVEIPLDPDFDGPALVRPDAAGPLGVDLAEIPGHADVQVALGRPFGARRAWVAAKCPTLDAEGVVEIAVPDAPSRKK